MKYEGATGRAEKLREDAIRTTGREVVRLTWPDLDRPVHVREMALAARARAARDLRR